MKIVNETVYNSDDLYNLFRAVDDASWAEIQNARWRIFHEQKAVGKVWTPSTYYTVRKDLPETVRVGYCGLPKQQRGTQGYTTLRNRYTTSPRVGIVKPEQLPLPPLMILAHCAEGATRTLPFDAVVSLVKSFSRTQRHSLDEKVRNDLAENHSVTFALKPKAGAKAAVKAAAEQAKIASLVSRRDMVDDDIKRMEAKLAALLARREGIVKKLRVLQPEQEMQLYV